MKLVCYVHSLTSGGAERVLAKLSNHWCAQGHDVYLVTNTPIDNDRYPLASGVTRLSLELPDTSNNLVHALIKTWRRQRCLNRLLKQLDVACVVAFMAPANVIATMATQSLNVPVVISERVHPPFLELSRLAGYFCDTIIPARRSPLIVQRVREKSYTRVITACSCH